MTAKNMTPERSLTPDCPLCQERIDALDAENTRLTSLLGRLRAELTEREGDVAWCEAELLHAYCPDAIPDCKQAG